VIIDKHIGPYVVYVEDSIQYALQKVNRNARRLVYCLSESGVLEGLVTDGDFRRWVVAVSEVDLQRPVGEIANRDFIFARDKDGSQDIQRLFSPKIVSIPVVDDLGRLTAIAWQEIPGLRLGQRVVREDKPAFLIAEIGNNHNGSLDVAKRLIDEAANAGVDCVKFQLRDMETLYAEGGKAVSEDLGAEYTLDLLRRFQLTFDEMCTAMDHARSRGLIPLCTPWDLVSLGRLVDYGVEGLKIASADLTNHELVRAAAATQLPLFVSTGMSSEREIIDVVTLLRREGAAFVLLQCNSTYPTPMRDVNLAYMDRLREMGQGLIGYSGHELGYEVCIAAVARGAKVIEKHITLDRSMEGNDHRVSLLPSEFTAMVGAIRNVEAAIGSGEARQISQGERLNREVLAKSLVAARDIAMGEVLSDALIEIRSPGHGLQPARLGDLVGIAACRGLKAGDVFYESDISGTCTLPRAYSFRRPWGIPVRYRDMTRLIEGLPLDLVEVHLSYRDLDLNPADYLEGPLEIGLVVHSPELFSGDHIMDLSSIDQPYRRRSVDELQRVIDRTRELKQYFPASPRPRVIINAGGFSAERFIPMAEREALYAQIGSSLSMIDAEGVEVIPQTMPPFPWHFGGQRYHNLFVAPEEIVTFCEAYGMGVCLDTSHSKLACNYFGWSMREFVRQVGPYAAHLHIVDARGHQDEGLQIGEGEIDFEALGEDLGQWAPEVSFIPEIWQGHKNAGEGFWVALDRLEKRFAEGPVARNQAGEVASGRVLGTVDG
jgi:sialic acid synthase SpsE/sugar phosphate isomerase/epimerase